MEGLVNIGVFLILLTIGFAAGRIAEKKHFQSILEREAKFAKIPTHNLDEVADLDNIASAKLAMSNVVVSLDYFKMVWAGLKSLVGGEITAYVPLMERGRREAILRMKESCPNADAFCGVRIETSSIARTFSAGKNKSVGGVEVIAVGTAIYYKK